LDEMNIADILTGFEGKTLEFKRDISSIKPILKTIVAFANTAGGSLVIGREDDGKICGVSNVLEAEETLANTIADSIFPALMPQIEIFTFEGKSLLIIRVAYWRGPFYLKSEGPEKGVYVRLGSTNRMAGPEILAELERTIQRVVYDQMSCPDLNVQDLDMNKVKRVFGAVDQNIDEQKLQSLGILVPYAGRLVISNGGLILFGSDLLRGQYFPDARVSCARFR